MTLLISGFEPEIIHESKEGVNEAESDRTVIELQTEIGSGSEEAIESETVPSGPIDFYQLFSSELQCLAEKPITVDELIESTQLNKSQLTEWLKRAVDDEVVKKLNRPVRYQVKNSE